MVFCTVVDTTSNNYLIKYYYLTNRVYSAFETKSLGQGYTEHHDFFSSITFSVIFNRLKEAAFLTLTKPLSCCSHYSTEENYN